MNRTIKIEPLTRIEGHASITIHLDHEGNVRDSRLVVSSFRGFEKFIQGRPAEEVPRIVTRICGICPWMHHLAACKAVDACFGLTPPRAGRAIRELCHLLAHIGDKILHFFFMAAPDFVMGPESPYSVRNIMAMVKQAPELANRVAEMRRLSQQMLESFAGKAIHPVAGVVGGFSKPMTDEDRKGLLKGAYTLLDFALFALGHAKKSIFSRYEELISQLGTIETGFLGTVDQEGNLRLYHGRLRLMKPDGSITEFGPDDYLDYIGEHLVPWSYAKMPYAKVWKEGFSLAPDSPKGIYRANTLARLNIADRISTPRAQEALEEFRKRFGRPAQSTLLYHWARLIELIYVCERAIEILKDREITDPEVRTPAVPRAGRGIGCVEAPRGTLIHDYLTDESGCIVKANMIVGTTHNVAPMNLSVAQAARSLIKKGKIDQGLLNRIEMAVRAYDP
jgi:F420-non-reducing hydrogenase large subunit